MTRREKTLLAITGLVAVVGIGSLLLGGKPRPAGPKVKVEAQQTATVESLTKAVAQVALSSADTNLLTAMQQPWRLSAVYDKSLDRNSQVGPPPTQHRYTGYVELGSGRLAVVDGYEYQVGDTLEGGGFKVVQITPERVTLESLANGNRENVSYEGQESSAR